MRTPVSAEEFSSMVARIAFSFVFQKFQQRDALNLIYPQESVDRWVVLLHRLSETCRRSESSTFRTWNRMESDRAIAFDRLAACECPDFS